MRRYFLFVFLLLAVGRSPAVTPVPVDIDPLGAEGEVPWRVHVTNYNVRTEPTVDGSTVVGQVSAGEFLVGEYNRVIESDEEWLRFDFEGEQHWVSCTGLHRVHPINQVNIDTYTDLPFGAEIVNRWWGLPSDYEASDLVTIPAGYTRDTNRAYLLRAEARDAFVAMVDAARLDGVDMRAASPYRSWDSQKSIYDGNINSAGLNQRFSAPPGHSEHQLGTTTDISAPGVSGFISNDTPQHDWLLENGAAFGWRQTYTAENIDQTGYIEEPWHWRYIGTALTTSPNSWTVY